MFHRYLIVPNWCRIFSIHSMSHLVFTKHCPKVDSDQATSPKEGAVRLRCQQDPALVIVLVISRISLLYHWLVEPPTPLKNHGVKVSWDDYSIPHIRKKYSKCSKPPTRSPLLVKSMAKSPFLRSTVPLWPLYICLSSRCTSALVTMAGMP